MQILPKKSMHPNTRCPFCLIDNAHGGAIVIVIALVVVLAVAGGGGYLAYSQYYKKEPLQTRLGSIKMKAELIRFTHDRVSTALYRNMIILDGIVVMMDKELDRLKRIGKKFPNQDGIIASQTQALNGSRDRLASGLGDVTAKIEKMYVTWLVDRSKGNGQINSQKGTLTRQLADAIRDETVLISRIRANPDSAS